MTVALLSLSVGLHTYFNLSYVTENLYNKHFIPWQGLILLDSLICAQCTDNMKCLCQEKVSNFCFFLMVRMSSHVVTKWTIWTAVHINLIVSYWSVLCHTDTIENNQVQLPIVTYHVLTGKNTSLNVNLSWGNILIFVLVTAYWLLPSSLLCSLRACDVVVVLCVLVCGVWSSNVLIIMLMD